MRPYGEDDRAGVTVRIHMKTRALPRAIPLGLLSTFRVTLDTGLEDVVGMVTGILRDPADTEGIVLEISEM